MKTTAPRMVKDTGKKIDWDDLIVGILAATVMLPFGVAVLFSLWHQSDTGLGWAIFIVGCSLMPKYSNHGVVSGLVATAYSIALTVALWQQNLAAVVIIAIAALGIEVFQFVSRKKKARKN